MNISCHLIHGLNFGIEHISKDLEAGIDETCILVDLGLLRLCIGMGDDDE